MFGSSGFIRCAPFRRLLRFSFSLPDVVNHRRQIHNGIVRNTRFKDSVPATMVPAASQDILLQNIQNAKDSAEVLHTINRHHTIMNNNHLLQALRSLFLLQKSQNSRISNGEVVSSKNFRKLCELLKSNIRHFTLNEQVDMLKCMAYLGVPSNSKIITLILNLISKQINDLSLQQISFLDFIMKDFKPTPLVKALKIAYPIVFEANLSTKCNFDDIPLMCELLYFAARRTNLGKSTDVLVEALTEKRHQLGTKDARNIVSALCDSKYFSDNHHLLLFHALDVLTDGVNTMDFYEMESLLSKLYSKHQDTLGGPSFYHEEFIDGCIRLVMEKDYSFEQKLWIFKKIVKFNHSHLPLLEHMAVHVELEPWQLEQSGATGLINFLKGLSASDYKPSNWHRIQPLVIKACESLMDRSELPWLRVLLDLCVLDCWKEDLFKKVFSLDFLSSFMSRDYNKLDHIQLLVLDQVAATLSPWAIKPRAPPAIIAPTIQKHGTHVTSFPLQAALQHGLGGPEYIKTGVTTSLGHFLDHVLVMRRGGYPIAINLGSNNRNTSDGEGVDRTSVEDIQIPPDSRMVAVLFVPLTMCSVNNERVKGIFRLQVNSIEALGIAVVPISQPLWNTLPDFERIPYLMRAIREKLPSTELSDVVTPV